jgi:hypothetical protein
MDNTNLGYHLINCILTHYPGGAQGFLDDGGSIAAVPNLNTCVIYLKDVPPAFQEFIDKLNKNGVFKIEIVNRVNFEGLTPKEAMSQISEACITIGSKYRLKEIIINHISKVLFVVSITDRLLSDKDVAEIAHIFMHTVKGLIRGVIVQGYDTFAFSAPVPTTPQQSEVLPEKIIEGPGISKDAIIDLKIALGQSEDVLDFLKRI